MCNCQLCQQCLACTRRHVHNYTFTLLIQVASWKRAGLRLHFQSGNLRAPQRDDPILNKLSEVGPSRNQCSQANPGTIFPHTCNDFVECANHPLELIITSLSYCAYSCLESDLRLLKRVYFTS